MFVTYLFQLDFSCFSYQWLTPSISDDSGSNLTFILLIFYILIFSQYSDVSVERITYRSNQIDSSVGWDCRIHWLHLCRGVRPPPKECAGYNTKQSDGKSSVMPELWRMRRTSLLPSLPSPLWPGLVTPDWVKWNKTMYSC